MKHIINFTDDRYSMESVGGKGLNLSILTGLGYNVPDGFIVTTDVFKRVVCDKGYFNLISEIELLQKDNEEELRKLSDKIRNYILSKKIDSETIGKIKSNLSRFGESNFAIRSSSTGEDLVSASFAGQQDTYLNIKKEDVVSYIKKCWASLFTDRAVFYRNQIGYDQLDISIAVVIQKIVDSKISGVAFSANPVNNARDEILIESTYGLGEALVSGLVTPDNYRISKEDYCIIEKNICDKEKMIQIDQDGLTTIKEIDSMNKATQSLSDKQAMFLAGQIQQIEGSYNNIPQDVEWCIDGNEELFILQSRPITTLYPLVESEDDGRYHLYMSFAHIQVMTETISPLGQSFIKLIFPAGKSKDGYYCEYMKSAGGRLYIDMTDVFERRIFARIYSVGVKGVDELIGDAISKAVLDEKFKSNVKIKKIGIFNIFRNFVRLFKSVARLLLISKDDNHIQRVNEYINGYYSKIEKIFSSCENGEQMHHALKEYGRVLLRDTVYDVAYYIVGGMICLKRLQRKAKRKGVDMEIVHAVLKGLDGNITTDMGLEIGDLADAFRGSGYEYVLDYDSYDKASSELARVGSADLLKMFNKFFNKFGFRGIGEIDIASKRWSEDSEYLFNLIKNDIQNKEVGVHRASYNKQRKEALDSVETIADKLGNKYKSIALKARAFLPIREHPKYFMMKCAFLIKEKILVLAEQLVENGKLDSVDDIFYLDIEEAFNLIINGHEYGEVIHNRKERYKEYKDKIPPRVMGSNGKIFFGEYDYTNIPEGAMAGSGVSVGMYEGIARVITNPNGAKVVPGEILISPQTDPAWTPLFVNAGAVVIEVGGFMTHGAVVAREYGLPAVVGVENATNKIKTGDRVLVNANRGYVIINKEEAK